MIPLVKDTISQSELKKLSKWLLSGNKLTKDKLTIKFEKIFSNYLGTKFSVFVNSGSSANLLMVYSLLESGKLKNKNAIVSSVSWVTTVSPLMQLGFNISLSDCDSNDLGVDLNHFEYLCKKNKPSIAIIVNVLGHSNKIFEIIKICKKYNVILLEDSCEALGSSINKKKLGSFGTAGSFSFYYGHHISTIEGGMVVTDDINLYNTMLSIRSHGWGRDLMLRYKLSLQKKYNIDDIRDLYTFYYPGFNLRSSDLNAFLGIEQLKKINKISLKRQKNFFHYKNLLNEYWFQNSLTSIISSFAFGTVVSNRLETYKYLKKNNIESRPLICGNIGRHPFWIKKFGVAKLPNADKIHEKGIYLPNNYNLSYSEIKYVASKFKEVAIPYKF
jgi:CDP-6-deoxy-D-xylo-4-hexulose-3-dehydrase